MEDETWTLTEKGIDTIIRIDELYRTTDYNLERIAVEVGLTDILDVRIMYATGVQMGIIDSLNGIWISDEYGD